MNKLFFAVMVSLLQAAFCLAAQAQKAPALPLPTVRPAIDGILAGFQNHPLVAIGNFEDYAQEEDFYAALVRDPRFARQVGNVVVEFGAGAHQDIIDRYLNGENVSFPDLRKVWSDVAGFNIPFAIGYVNFFVAVRNVNRTLPPGQRIHVWLGEPPIDWSKIKSQAELVRYFPQRDSHPAEIVEKQILAKNRKALLLYGDGHLYRRPDNPAYLPLGSLIQQKHPGAVFIVEMYTGFATKPCTTAFEQIIQHWPTPAVAMPVRGSSLEKDLRRPGCDVLSRAEFRFAPSTPAAERTRIADGIEEDEAGLNADALLYVSKAATLTQSPYDPSLYLDPDYLREMNRRTTLGFEFNLNGRPMGHVSVTDAIVQSNPASPKYVRHY